MASDEMRELRGFWNGPRLDDEKRELGFGKVVAGLRLGGGKEVRGPQFIYVRELVFRKVVAGLCISGWASGAVKIVFQFPVLLSLEFIPSYGVGEKSWGVGPDAWRVHGAVARTERGWSMVAI